MSQEILQRVERPRTVDALDKALSLWLHKHVAPILPRSLYMVLEHSGNGILWLLLSMSAWYTTSRKDVRLHWLNFFLGLWVDIAIVGGLKALVKRARPEYNISADFILVVSVDNYSFPSGHAARVSYVATYAIATFAGKNIWLASAISLWAVLTAFSRALMGRHYLGDVTIGVALGFLTTAIGSKVGPFAPVQAHKQAM